MKTNAVIKDAVTCTLLEAYLQSAEGQITVGPTLTTYTGETIQITNDNLGEVYTTLEVLIGRIDNSYKVYLDCEHTCCHITKQNHVSTKLCLSSEGHKFYKLTKRLKVPILLMILITLIYMYFQI